MEFQKFERDFLDEVILSLTEELIVLIEIGCGTGRLLLQYVNPYSPLAGDRKISDAKRLKLATQIIHIVGIDSSNQMIRRLKQNLQKTEYTVSGTTNEVSIVERDAKELSSFLPALLKKKHRENFCRVFCIMLCTLGNMRKKTRKTVLQEIRKVMNPRDILVVSVWNRALFKRGVEEIYRKFTGLIGEFNEENVNYGEAEIVTNTEYYIHWFSRGELQELLSENGFEVEDIKPKTKEFYIVARATPR